VWGRTLAFSARMMYKRPVFMKSFVFEKLSYYFSKLFLSCI
jgi:hypothetical protein